MAWTEIVNHLICWTCGRAFNSTTGEWVSNHVYPQDDRSATFCKACGVERKQWGTTTDIGEGDARS